MSTREYPGTFDETIDAPLLNDGEAIIDLPDGFASGLGKGKLAKTQPANKAPQGDNGLDGWDAESIAKLLGGESDKVIAELAKLSKLKYEKHRKEVAKGLGVRTKALDEVVDDARDRIGHAALAAALYEHWKVDPWPHAVDTGILLQAIENRIKLYAVLPAKQEIVIALWVMLTWVHYVATHSPLLLVTSPEANSGKSTLLGVIGLLARRGLTSVNISGPALFRSIEKWQPTFVIDEADTALVNNEDLKEVVNSGWTRGQNVIRCDPQTYDPRPYSTFAPKVIGMKGRKLPDTTLSRAIIIGMKRKLPGETVQDFDYLDDGDLARLRRELLRWATDNAEGLRVAQPKVIPGLHNRDRANWKLLLAIAELAGNAAKDKAWEAARAIEGVKDASSTATQLFMAIQAMFASRVEEGIFSRDMIENLVADLEGPWREFRRGKPITQRQLAGLLREFGIGSGDIHLSDKSHGKGYRREQFAEVWARYL